MLQNENWFIALGAADILIKSFGVMTLMFKIKKT